MRKAKAAGVLSLLVTIGATRMTQADEPAAAPAADSAPAPAPDSASAPAPAPAPDSASAPASAPASASASAPATYIWPSLPAAPAPPSFATRSVRIGPSVQMFLLDPFPFEKISKVGTGLFGVYEFYLKPAFAIGINLSYRVHPGEATLHQIGYGLLMKHYLSGTSSTTSTFLPFVEYGLLLQINLLSDRKGSGTSHDTRLSVGTDIRLKKTFLFVEGSWHYSRLGIFDQKAERLDSLEFDLGYRLPW